MRKVLLVMAVVLLATVAGVAAPIIPTGAVSCNTVQTMADALALSAGCYNQDKLYFNFTYSNPSGEVATDFVDVGARYRVVGAQDIHSLSFTGGWTTPFTITYNVRVLDPELWITQLSLDFTTAPGNSPTVTQTSNPLPGALVATWNDRPAGTLTNGVRHLAVSINGTPNNFIDSVVSTYTQSAVPEPATYAMLGAGLVALAYGVRRRKA